MWALTGCTDIAIIGVVETRRDAGTTRPADAGDTRVSDAGARPPDAGAAPVVDARSCGRTGTFEGCNPIANTGCSEELRMQCDVDALASLQGVCVFKAMPPQDGSCLNVPPTESCPPRQTCVNFSSCRTLCLCDGDCDPGDCCTTPLGETGFRTCSACR